MYTMLILCTDETNRRNSKAKQKLADKNKTKTNQKIYRNNNQNARDRVCALLYYRMCEWFLI